MGSLPSGGRAFSSPTCWNKWPQAWRGRPSSKSGEATFQRTRLRKRFALPAKRFRSIPISTLLPSTYSNELTLDPARREHTRRTAPAARSNSYRPETNRRRCKPWGLKDEEIITLMLRQRSVTFFTRDMGFYRRELRHPRYCLAVTMVGQTEVATFVRRFVRHPDFNTQAKRMGAVVRFTHARLWSWRLRSHTEVETPWKP